MNLSGANIGGGRWSGARRAELRSSRIDLTRVLVEHLGSLAEGDRPAVLVNQSAVGFYGDRGDAELGEDAGRGLGFLADLVADWEAEAQRAEEHGIRTVRPPLGDRAFEAGAAALADAAAVPARPRRHARQRPLVDGLDHPRGPVALAGARDHLGA